MGFLGAVGSALSAPIRKLPGARALSKPLNKSPLGRGINRSLGMGPSKQRPMSPSPGVVQGAMSQAKPSVGMGGMKQKMMPTDIPPDVQAARAADPGGPGYDGSGINPGGMYSGGNIFQPQVMQPQGPMEAPEAVPGVNEQMSATPQTSGNLMQQDGTQNDQNLMQELQRRMGGNRGPIARNSYGIGPRFM